MNVELCACGHELDHRGKACRHENCICQNGVRVDVATFRVMSAIQRDLSRLLAVTEIATQLESRLLVAENGAQRVDVRSRGQESPRIIVPS